MEGTIRIGTAGWSIPKQHAAEFPVEGTHLERYARHFPAVEINSSFYRSHRIETYARWAASVPPGFRFAVKVPCEISHRCKLVAATVPLDRFLTEVQGLRDTLGPLLLQLPPSASFDEAVVGTFLNALRARFDGDVVCEPRHSSWFSDAVDGMLSHFRVARVAADPAPAPRAVTPGGWLGIIYQRLHGSPEMYYSAYSTEELDIIAQRMRELGARRQESWCIFDNTARGEAAKDAMSLLAQLQPR